MRANFSATNSWLRASRLVCAGAMLAASQAVLALGPPTGDIILTVSGKVSQPNKGANALFDMKMLEKLPQHSFTTKTPWYPNAVSFSGPLLRDVLQAAGAKGAEITAVALNDYKTQIPFDDVSKHDVIVAIAMNNRPMPVREKGPLFIIYPFDSKTELNTERYYNRSAWQLNALQVR
jgi:hypothetical protein